jgi:asparagine synthase (glutamine-hydrolysing)
VEAVKAVSGQFRMDSKRYLTTDAGSVRETAIDEAFQHARDDTAHRLMTFDVRYSLPSNLLYKIDRATMSASLEARVPFLDHHIVEFAHALPNEEILNGRYKPLLRGAVEDLLPERTLSRSKSGFNLPLADWFREGHESIDRWFTPSVLDTVPFVDSGTVKRLHRNHRRGRENHDVILWKLMSYVCWYHTVVKQYVD